MVPCFPRASRSSRLPSVVSSVAAACFWLVVVCCFADWRPFKATTYFIFLFFVAQFAAPKRYANAISLACRSARLPSIIPPNASANFWLVVVSIDEAAAT
jgi:hypothetical protein